MLATRTVAIETDSDVAPGRPLPELLRALTHVSTTYPGFTDDETIRAALMPEFRALLLDRNRFGTVSQSIAALSSSAQGVRDQLSNDVWMVLAEIDRAFAALASTREYA